ncbi:MAG: hypothetical protein LBC82_06815 [Oscillospiraceae bacterium]|jgi:hypothetical protein|nr:hypothetical protein [Oscillospiraceae bacterium]
MLQKITGKKTNSLIRKDGAILITVLATMTLLLMLAMALFLTIAAERGEVFEDAKSEQLYQTATSVNDWVFDYLDRYITTLPSGARTDEIDDGFIRAFLELPPFDPLDPDASVMRTGARIPLSVGGSMGEYEIIIRRLEDLFIPSEGRTIARFEFETIIRNDNDEQSFIRLIEYELDHIPAQIGSFQQHDDFDHGDVFIWELPAWAAQPRDIPEAVEGVWEPPGDPGTSPGGRNEDDGFFEVPASYRGRPTIADNQMSFDQINLNARSYFGGYFPRQGNKIVTLSHPLISAGFNSFGCINAQEAQFIPQNEVININIWGDFEFRRSQGETQQSNITPSSVIRARSFSTSSAHHLMNGTVMYIFGDASFDGARIPNNMTIYATGRVTINTSQVGNNVTIHTNTGVAFNNPNNAGQIGANLNIYTRGGANSITGSNRNLVTGNVRSLPAAWNGMGWPLFMHIPEGMTLPGVTEITTGINNGAIFQFLELQDNVGYYLDGVIMRTEFNSNGQIIQSRVTTPGTEGHDPSVTDTAFKQFWAPQWRPQTNPQTDRLDPTTRSKLTNNANNAINLTASTASTTRRRRGDQPPPGGGSWVNYGANTVVISDSGRIASGQVPTTGASPIRTIIIDTTNGFPDDPTQHKDIYLVLHGASQGNQFAWQNSTNTDSYLNILVKGAGSVIFALDNKDYAPMQHMFVGHLAWVQEFNAASSFNITHTSDLAGLFIGTNGTGGVNGTINIANHNLMMNTVRNALHPLYDCGTENGLNFQMSCKYCNPSNKLEYAYTEYFGRYILRQDNGSNLIEKHGASGTQLYIHNNIFFVTDMDSESNSTGPVIYGRRNVIMGFIYAPGAGVPVGNFINNNNDNSFGFGGYIIGDFRGSSQLRSRIAMTHIMPVDYYRNPEGRTDRGVVSELVGESFRGMQFRPPTPLKCGHGCESNPCICVCPDCSQRPCICLKCAICEKQVEDCEADGGRCTVCSFCGEANCTDCEVCPDCGKKKGAEGEMPDFNECDCTCPRCGALWWQDCGIECRCDFCGEFCTHGEDYCLLCYERASNCYCPCVKCGGCPGCPNGPPGPGNLDCLCVCINKAEGWSFKPGMFKTAGYR